MPDPASKAVFLSYASQDAEAATRICEALRAGGVEVWLDQSELVGGDAWDQKIRGQVASCTLFVPVVSAATQARREGYFRLEWKLADERTHLMAEGTPFLLPVVIDDTKDREALVPKSFLGVQWTRLPGGETTPAFVTRVQKLLGGPSAPTATAAPEVPTAAGFAPAARTGLPHWVGIALGVVVLALIGFLVMRPGAKDAVPVAKSVAEMKPSPVAVPVDKSIAVLPFENLSDDKDNTAFFSDGMHEDILTNLANIPQLRVVSRTSVMQYRDTKKPIPQIARELGVAYINHALRLAPDNLEIIRLLGVYAYYGYRDYPRAAAQLEKVIRLQPNNADAIFSLGGVQRRQGRWLESLTNMRRALELDPRNPRFMFDIANSLIAGRRWNEAMALSRKLVEADSSDGLGNGLSYLALIEFLATGSTKQGDDWLARQTQAQLGSPQIMAWRKIWAVNKGDYAEWKRLDEIQPFGGRSGSPAQEVAAAATIFAAHGDMAGAAATMLAAHGDMAGAATRLGGSLAEVRAELLVQPSNAKLWAALSQMEALLGQNGAALRDAQKAIELLPESVDAVLGTVFTANLATVYAWIGDKDRAIAEITRLLGIPTFNPGDTVNLRINVHTLRVDPAFAPLRGDPRFEALLNDPKNNAPLF